MNRTLYVGNLAFHTTAANLTQAFGHYGSVVRASVVMNPETGESRGFGYVEMSDGGDQAVIGLNGSLYQGRPLCVHQTKPLMEITWPEDDDRESIRVMPDHQSRGEPLDLVESPSNKEGAGVRFRKDLPAIRDAEAYTASQNGSGYRGSTAT